MLAIRKIVAAGVVAGALALSAVAGAAAFHPGVNDNPDHELPQGPKLVACENQGGALNPTGQGVFNAIERGGNVHCDEGGFPD
jgi:hypothetical protein